MTTNFVQELKDAGCTDSEIAFILSVEQKQEEVTELNKAIFRIDQNIQKLINIIETKLND